jgi:hypothetical protein
MRRVQVSQTGVGQSQIVPVDQYVNSTQVTLGVVVTGTVTYNVLYTLDDINAAGFSPSTANWYVHTVLTNLTASACSNFMFPVTATCVAVTAGTGTATLTVLQSGAL